VVALEAAADDIRKALYAIRPRDPKQAELLAAEISKIQRQMIHWNNVDVVLREKQKLLHGLTPDDHKSIPGLLGWLDGMREVAKGKDVKDGKARMERYDLLERILKLIV
jgi:hypothetical protein